MDDPLIHPASLNAARPGARVEVRSPQGSRFDGETGTIRRVYDGTAFVALDHQPVAMPFALGELVSVSRATRRRKCEVDYMAGAICSLPINHDGSHWTR